jgi:cell division protein ZapA (FtsZ GTPase activity inhibitor)
MAQKSDAKQRKSTTVKIFGREYRIRSDERDESVQRIARFVDEKMQETARRAQAADPVGVAVLAAMNIAGEYFPARDDREATAGITAERVRRLIQIVDGSLAQTGSARGSSRARH